MKKTLLLIITLLITSLSLNAEEKEIKTFKLDGKQTAGKLKAGVSLGYPTGITAGWSFSNYFEANLLVATNFEGFTIGFSPLFTVINLEISNELFPLSIGPAVNFNIDGKGEDLDLLGIVRVEYSFKEIPLNLFLEGGAGIKMELGNDADIRFGGSGALGLRYIF